MDVHEILLDLDNNLKKENKDLFNNRVDVRFLFTLQHLDLTEGIGIFLKNYEIVIKHYEELGSGVFKYVFHNVIDGYIYTSLDLDDFIKNIKDYIPYLTIDVIPSGYIEGWNHILNRN